MFFKTSILLMAFVALAAAAPSSGIAPTTSLLDFMLQSQSLRTATNLNMECFDWYLPILKGHSDQYEEDYKACNENYRAALWLIDSSYNIARTNVSNRARETCAALELCDNEQDNARIFECYAKTAPEQSSKLTGIGHDAADFNKQLRAELDLIDSNLDTCQTTAKRVYNEKAGATFDELTACLDDEDWAQPTTVSN